jgi:hypothetical protein
MWIRYFSLFVLLVVMLPNAFGECASSSGWSSISQLLSFLREAKQPTSTQKDADRIVYAIGQLEYKYSPGAAKLLAEYLDFERPLTEAEHEGFMIHGPLTIGNKYPATGILMTFGERALPELLSTIKISASETARRNASYTVMQIYRDEPPRGIALLKGESTKVGPPGAARLRIAAEEACAWCGAKYKKQCQAKLAR